MNHSPFFTIIMPTYNSESTIEKTLSSLCGQTLFPSEVELLVIDGGSADATVEIAIKSGARVLSNPERVPEAAKLIGLNEARGKYIVEMDSDEVFISETQLENRKRILEQNPDIYVMIPKQFLPLEHNGFYSAYSTLLGDPFSFFIYRCCGNYADAYRKNIIKEENGAILFEFSDNDIIPIADGGTTTISLDHIKSNFNDRMGDHSFAACMASEIIRQTGRMVCPTDDTMIHNNRMDRKSYLSKLRFRIINNLFEVEKSGFSSRTKGNQKQQYKKYLFIPYCVLLIPVIFDSLFLSIKLKNIRYMEHFLLSLYVLFLIGVYMLLKLIGIKKSNTSYGK